VVDALRGKPTGRLIEYDPARGTATTIAAGIWFANGVALAADESFALVCETASARVLRVWLDHGRRGEIEVFASGFPGFVDGIDRAPVGGSGSTVAGAPAGFWVAVPSPPPLSVKVLAVLPAAVHDIVRAAFLRLPASLRPGPVPFGCAVLIDAWTGKKLRYLVDPLGASVTYVTSAVERDGKLYLGSLTSDYVAVFDVQEEAGGHVWD